MKVIEVAAIWLFLILVMGGGLFAIVLLILRFGFHAI